MLCSKYKCSKRQLLFTNDALKNKSIRVVLEVLENMWEANLLTSNMYLNLF